jgi:hypothetical protein
MRLFLSARMAASVALFLTATVPVLAVDSVSPSDPWKVTIRPRVRVAQADGNLPVPTPPSAAPVPTPANEGVQPKVAPAPSAQPSPEPPAPSLPTPAEPESRPARVESGIVIIPMAAKDCTTTHTGMTYREAYASVPYSLTEYLANPGYRHDAAMEIMFGQMRPTTIQKNYTPQVIEEPEYSPYRPALFNSPEGSFYPYVDYRKLWYYRPMGFSPFGPY